MTPWLVEISLALFAFFLSLIPLLLMADKAVADYLQSKEFVRLTNERLRFERASKPANGTVYPLTRGRWFRNHIGAVR